MAPWSTFQFLTQRWHSIVLRMRAAWKRFSLQRVWQALAVICSLSGVFLLAAWLLFLPDESDPASKHSIWIMVSALTPAIMILNHGLFLHFLRPKDLVLAGKAGEDWMDDAVKRVNAEIGSEYGNFAIFIDYYLPTALTAVTGLALAYVLCSPGECCGPISDAAQEGLRFGGLGAFVVVLMSLSERTFRRDISSGTAMSSAVQLILGPIFGAVLAETIAGNVELTNFSQRILYFAAGMAPKQLMLVIQDVADKFWSNGAMPPRVRTISLTELRGITPAIALRLREEGIEDVYGLAMANPIRLAKSTPYELKLVVNWIDEALLVATLPDEALLLQKQGITGSIDLAYYYVLREEMLEEDVAPKPAGGPKKKVVAAQTPARSSRWSIRLKELAETAHLKPEMLEDTIRRLYEDTQVQQIWALYQAQQVQN